MKIINGAIAILATLNATNTIDAIFIARCPVKLKFVNWRACCQCLFSCCAAVLFPRFSNTFFVLTTKKDYLHLFDPI